MIVQPNRAVLRTVASRARARAKADAELEDAIMAALRQHHSAPEVGRAAGLSKSTVQRIARRRLR